MNAEPSRNSGSVPANWAAQRGARLRTPFWFILVAGVVLCLASLACSVGQAVVGRPETEPTATKTKQPTFTPIPGVRNVITTPAALVRGELPPGVTVEAPGGNLGPSGQFSGTLSLTGRGQAGGIAWWAHVGGFVFGLAVCLLAQRKRPASRERFSFEDPE